jgi:hypothetical protein
VPGTIGCSSDLAVVKAELSRQLCSFSVSVQGKCVSEVLRASVGASCECSSEVLRASVLVKCTVQVLVKCFVLVL